MWALELHRDEETHTIVTLWLCSYLECLEARLEALEVTCGSPEDRPNYSRRKRCIGLLLGFREEWKRYSKWPEREVAAHDVR